MLILVADRQGFEPWRRLPAYTLSKRAPSTTRPPVLISNERSDFTVLNPAQYTDMGHQFKRSVEMRAINQGIEKQTWP